MKLFFKQGFPISPDNLEFGYAMLHGLSHLLKRPLVGIKGLAAEGNAPIRLIRPSGDPNQQTGAGSATVLPFHTDTAFLDGGPVEWAALLCVIGHPEALTFFVDLNTLTALLSRYEYNVLTQERFVTRAPMGVYKDVRQVRHAVILPENAGFSFSGANTSGTDDEAAVVLRRFITLIETAEPQTFALKSGDIVVWNNRAYAHARSPFTAAQGKNSRFLMRAYYDKRGQECAVSMI